MNNLCKLEFSQRELLLLWYNMSIFYFYPRKKFYSSVLLMLYSLPLNQAHDMLTINISPRHRLQRNLFTRGFLPTLCSHYSIPKTQKLKILLYFSWKVIFYAMSLYIDQSCTGDKMYSVLSTLLLDGQTKTIYYYTSIGHTYSIFYRVFDVLFN